MKKCDKALSVGCVVMSLAGKDKGRFFCVTELIRTENSVYCFLRDGDIHKLENPKRKNFKHVLNTPYNLQSEALQANKHLKKAIDSLINL